MLIAQRNLKLAPHGNVRAGQPVPEKLWAALRERTRRVLVSSRRVVSSDTVPRPGRKKA